MVWDMFFLESINLIAYIRDLHVKGCSWADDVLKSERQYLNSVKCGGMTLYLNTFQFFWLSSSGALKIGYQFSPIPWGFLCHVLKAPGAARLKGQ